MPSPKGVTMKLRNFIEGNTVGKVKAAESLYHARLANRAGTPRPGNRPEPHMRGYRLNRGATEKHRYPYHVLSATNRRRLAGQAGLRVLEATMNPKGRGNIVASGNNWRAYNYGRGRTLKPSARQIAAEIKKAEEKAAREAAAKAKAAAEAAEKASRSGSGTRKSPHSRAGNVRLTFRNESGKEVTKAVKNLTEEEEFFLTSDQMDKLIAYHLDTIHGFRK
jgi:hypothetical protein